MKGNKVNTLKLMSKAYAEESKRLRRLETKSVPNEALEMDERQVFEKYGKGLTLVQWCRLTRRHRRVLSVPHRQNLHRVRTVTLRRESRCTGLARAYFAGKNYSDIEKFCYELPNWDRVQQIVESNIHHGKDQREVMQQFSEWLYIAKEYIRCYTKEREVLTKIENDAPLGMTLHG